MLLRRGHCKCRQRGSKPRQGPRGDGDAAWAAPGCPRGTADGRWQCCTGASPAAAVRRARGSLRCLIALNYSPRPLRAPRGPGKGRLQAPVQRRWSSGAAFTQERSSNSRGFSLEAFLVLQAFLRGEFGVEESLDRSDSPIADKHTRLSLPADQQDMFQGKIISKEMDFPPTALPFLLVFLKAGVMGCEL